MAAGDVVPRNRPGDQIRQLRDLEKTVRELTAVLSRSTPKGETISALTGAVVLAPSWQGKPQLSSSLTVPPGMTAVTALATVGLTAINSLTAEGTISAAAGLTVDAGALDAGAAQSTTVPPGKRGHLHDSRADHLAGLVAGQTVTWSALAWTDAGEWAQDTTRTVLDLQVVVTWFA